MKADLFDGATPPLLNQDEYGIPDGISQGLTVSQVARALRLGESTVKTALKSGVLASWRLSSHSRWRYVTPEALAAFAAQNGMRVYWDELL